MTNKYILISCLLFLTMCVSPVMASTYNINSTWGENWIEWQWDIPDSHLVTSSTFRVVVDGVVVIDTPINTTTYIPERYVLSDVNPNERHVIELLEFNASAALEYSETSVSSTALDSGFFYILFVISTLIAIVSAGMRNRVIGAFLPVISIVMYIYISITVLQYNVAFSTISLIFAVMAGVISIYSMYVLAKINSTWVVD